MKSDRIICIFRSGESEIFDFEIGAKFAPVEGEDANPSDAHLYLVDNEKQKEHDSKVTGVDSSRHVHLIVTSDAGGSIKLWSLDKRFMREISFPHPIDGVCFLNERGDILVSHVHRISKICYETYWTSSFTHFGFTKTTDQIHIRYKETEATIETEIYDDHVYWKPPPGRTRIISSEQFEELFRMKTEEEIMASQSQISKAEAESLNLGSTLRKTGAALMKGAGGHGRKQSGLIASSDQGASQMDINVISSRLGDSALRQMKAQAGPLGSGLDLTKDSKASRTSIKAVANAVGAISFLSKLTATNSQLQKT